MPYPHASGSQFYKRSRIVIYDSRLDIYSQFRVVIYQCPRLGVKTNPRFFLKYLAIYNTENMPKYAKL